MSTIKKIKLSDLTVNTENYRFEPLASQREAIEVMIENQKDNLYNLAEHIQKYGLNPNGKIEVTALSDDKSKFIVLEGNRRTITLKIINNPDLIEGDKYVNLKKKFKKLRDENLHNLISEVECVVYDSPEEADVWIGLKHGYGISGTYTDNWGPLPKQRYQEKTEGKTSTSLQIIKLLKNSTETDKDIKENVEKIRTTNLDRLIDDPEVRGFLGIEINNGIIQSNTSEKEIVKGLSQVIRDILDPKFSVKNIYTKSDRQKYINDFPKGHIPDTDKKTPKPWRITDGSAEVVPVPVPSPPISPRPKPNPKDRKTLIPKTCILKIDTPKVNTIFHELKKLDISYTNAVAVLFRVFVELSVDSYIEAHKLVSTPSAARSGMAFQQKINQVANHLETKSIADAAICKGVKSAVKDANDILGIDTWHAYVHNNKFAPKPENLIITWDNMQEFMVLLWNNVI